VVEREVLETSGKELLRKGVLGPGSDGRQGSIPVHGTFKSDKKED